MSSTSVTETSHQAEPAEDHTATMLRAAEANHTKPLWLQMTKLNPPLPNPRCTPHLWKYSEIQPTLLQAGQLVTEKQAERRVLMLVNPSRDAPFTTDTLYAGLQLVMPNETAPAHRHTAFAMRFIIEGNGGFTAVHGKRIQMNRGDVILTPTWNWHDHGKDGSGPMIWLDGLDLPNFTHFPVHFVEHFSSPRYPADNVDTSQSPIVFPWSRMKAALDAEEGQYATQSYLRADGSEVSKVLGGRAARLTSGAKSSLVQETASSVYHVVEGSGRSRIGDTELVWNKGDTFCIPSWYPYQHFADEGLKTDVYLYRFDDMPMLKSLGFYRSADMDVERLVSK
ncbi:gentisate 1,2-dioxygenase [Colletotrichum tamarilloi]|uniref:Gentisate 1,2-dioxygenase n=1 Tax=Colletotrichum tamarilloi TaxID=1209934 RepID=A0ABQ9QWW6_9PEZI|nr:gentisate 1,2-dioxygenase [Colletotrichum tamarilloi]KAK1487616.1 gentisate 1,2-dioxygenase [Colletotrichum tamarilloi]